VLKFSREESAVMAEALGIAGEDLCTAMCKELAKRYPRIKQILVTLDKDGSFVYLAAEDRILYSPKPGSKAVSTVGAGDSFSACYVYNLLTGADTETCLARATALSDYVVTQLGAVPEYPAELIAKIK
jgi:fructokinase